MILTSSATESLTGRQYLQISGAGELQVTIARGNETPETTVYRGVIDVTVGPYTVATAATLRRVSGELAYFKSVADGDNEADAVFIRSPSGGWELKDPDGAAFGGGVTFSSRAAAIAGTNNTTAMTPLRVAEVLAEQGSGTGGAAIKTTESAFAALAASSGLVANTLYITEDSTYRATSVSAFVDVEAGGGGGGESSGSVGELIAFGAQQSATFVEWVRVTSTSDVTSGLANESQAIACIKVIATGSSGTLTIHDDDDASDATKLRVTIPFGSLAVNKVFPLAGGGAMIFSGRPFITFPAGSPILLVGRVQKVA